MTDTQRHQLESFAQTEPRAHTGRGLVAFLGLSLGVFVAGGIFFGIVFLANVRTLMAHGQRTAVTVDVPVAGKVSLPLRAPSMSDLPNIAPQVPRINLPAPSSQPAPSEPAVALPDWGGTKPVGILLLGVDRRSDEDVENTRTDTMMLVMVNPQTKAAAMISIPRDLWVQIPGFGGQRINVAHAVGGPDLAKQTVAQSLGMPVDYYARIDFSGFEKIVDTVGGVIVDVERPIKDDEYPTENFGTTRIYIPPGPQLMSGAVALQYVRSRHSENDFGRMERQQRFLVALRDRGLQLNMLPKLPSLIGLAQDAVSTDLGPVEMLSLAKLGSELQRDRITSLVLDTRFADPYRSPEGADLLLPRAAAIQAAVQRLLSGAAASGDEKPRVEVLNGTEQAGLAHTAADFLASQGYRVTRVASAERSDYGESVITVLGGGVQSGYSLAADLKLPDSVVRNGESEADTDIRIILGSSFRFAH